MLIYDMRKNVENKLLTELFTLSTFVCIYEFVNLYSDKEWT